MSIVLTDLSLAEFQVGDIVEAVYEEDGIWYEAEILEFDAQAQTWFVEFLGYGNEQECDITMLRYPLDREEEVIRHDALKGSSEEEPQRNPGLDELLESEEDERVSGGKVDLDSLLHSDDSVSVSPRRNVVAGKKGSAHARAAKPVWESSSEEDGMEDPVMGSQVASRSRGGDNDALRRRSFSKRNQALSKKRRGTGERTRLSGRSDQVRLSGSKDRSSQSRQGRDSDRRGRTGTVIAAQFIKSKQASGKEKRMTLVPVSHAMNESEEDVSSSPSSEVDYATLGEGWSSLLQNDGNSLDSLLKQSREELEDELANCDDIGQTGEDYAWKASIVQELAAMPVVSDESSRSYWEQAAQLLEAAVDTDPESAEYRTQLAHLHLRRALYYREVKNVSAMNKACEQSSSLYREVFKVAPVRGVLKFVVLARTAAPSLNSSQFLGLFDNGYAQDLADSRLIQSLDKDLRAMWKKAQTFKIGDGSKDPYFHPLFRSWCFGSLNLLIVAMALEIQKERQDFDAQASLLLWMWGVFVKLHFNDEAALVALYLLKLNETTPNLPSFRGLVGQLRQHVRKYNLSKIDDGDLDRQELEKIAKSELEEVLADLSYEPDYVLDAIEDIQGEMTDAEFDKQGQEKLDLDINDFQVSELCEATCSEDSLNQLLGAKCFEGIFVGGKAPTEVISAIAPGDLPQVLTTLAFLCVSDVHEIMLSASNALVVVLRELSSSPEITLTSGLVEGVLYLLGDENSDIAVNGAKALEVLSAEPRCVDHVLQFRELLGPLLVDHALASDPVMIRHVSLAMSRLFDVHNEEQVVDCALQIVPDIHEEDLAELVGIILAHLENSGQVSGKSAKKSPRGEAIPVQTRCGSDATDWIEKARGILKTPLPAVGEEMPAASEWKVGDECEAIWDEDGVWYLAEILEDLNDGYFLVRFTEYGNEQETGVEMLRRLAKDDDTISDIMDVVTAIEKMATEASQVLEEAIAMDPENSDVKAEMAAAKAFVASKYMKVAGQSEDVDQKIGILQRAVKATKEVLKNAKNYHQRDVRTLKSIRAKVEVEIARLKSEKRARERDEEIEKQKMKASVNALESSEEEQVLNTSEMVDEPKGFREVNPDAGFSSSEEEMFDEPQEFEEKLLPPPAKKPPTPRKSTTNKKLPLPPPKKGRPTIAPPPKKGRPTITEEDRQKSLPKPPPRKGRPTVTPKDRARAASKAKPVSRRRGFSDSQSSSEEEIISAPARRGRGYTQKLEAKFTSDGFGRQLVVKPKRDNKRSFPAPVEDSSESMDDLFTKGISTADQEELAQALELFDQGALSCGSEDLDELTQIEAQSLIEDGVDERVVTLLKVGAAFEDKLTDAFEEGDEEYAKELLDKAVAKYDLLVRLAPESQIGLRRMADALVRKAELTFGEEADSLYARVINIYQKDIDLGPSNESYYQMAQAMVDRAKNKAMDEKGTGSFNQTRRMLAEAKQVALLIDEGQNEVLDIINDVMDFCKQQQDTIPVEPIPIAVAKPLPQPVKQVKQSMTSSGNSRPSSQNKKSEKTRLEEALAAKAPINKTGRLCKKGGGQRLIGRKTWKHRLFRLSETKLEYFSGSTDEKPKGAIELILVDTARAITIAGKFHTFELVTEGRNYPMQATSDTERDDWVKSIVNNVDRLKLAKKLLNYKKP